MSAAPRPPAHIEAYVRALGAQGAVRFLLAYGGTEFHVPRDPGPEHPFAAEYGWEAARALADLAVAGVLPREVPLGKPWVARHLFTEGLSKTEIARRLHVSRPTVAHYLKDGPPRRFPTLLPEQLHLDL